MACIAPIKNSHGQRQAPEEGNLEPPRRASKCDAPNRVMTTSSTPPSSCRSQSRPKLSPRDINQTGERARGVSAHLGDASKEWSDTHGHRRRQHQPKTGKTFVRVAAHLPLNPPEWGKRPHCSHRHHRNTSSSWSKCRGTPTTRTYLPPSPTWLSTHSPLHLPPPAGRDFLPQRCCRSPDSCEVTESQQPRSGHVGPKSGPHLHHHGRRHRLLYDLCRL
jgi:hypothetical protein